ncbi:MAG: hypothetical protein ACRDFX_08005 [Chloroflexota bacterium]
MIAGGYGIPTLGLLALNVGGQFTVTKDWHVYVGLHAGPGLPGPSGYIGAGYIGPFGPTTECQRDTFVSGSGVAAHAQVPVFGPVGPAVSLVYGTPGQTGPHSVGVEAGIGVGLNVSAVYGYSQILARRSIP